jgi:hypothetical protein
MGVGGPSQRWVNSAQDSNAEPLAADVRNPVGLRARVAPSVRNQGPLAFWIVLRRNVVTP